MATSSGDWSQLLRNKIVFVTGAAGHIAKSIVKTCYLHGARIVMGDLDPTVINKVKQEIFCKEQNFDDDRILIVKLDVTDEKSIEQAIQITIETWKTIDILLNTAATYVLGNVEEVSAEDWSHVFDVNVRGYALVAKHIAPILKKQRNGSIVNMASISGSMASSNWIPYSTTKSAILQLTRNLALDLGSFNIRVNSVSPSGVNTPRTFEIGESRGIDRNILEEAIKGKCLQRTCQPEEIANLFVFLASDLCPFMTGANLPIDGGSSIV
ncbi:hypothetical protein I4U23_021629 [Adineta vaga]|nr:hypothetical protein I4U23_021629 [Adineta vaga]